MASFDALDGQQFINLTTFRKSGEQVVTPVWFARAGDVLYVTTPRGTGKVKRIGNNPAVLVGPADRSGKALGQTIAASARVLPEIEWANGEALLTKKYGLMKQLITFVSRLRGGTNVVLAIVPA